MSNGNPVVVRKRAQDRRVLRTRRALGSALVELMLAREFDDISVQQVLDRARVGRATFYSHFRNKHDLLLSDAERVFDALERHFIASAGSSRRVAPVTELFSHVAEFQRFIRAVEQTPLRESVYDLLTGHLAQIILRRLSEISDVGRRSGLPPPATARVLAAALVEMMRWWLEHGAQPAARDMDAQFHQIVWEGLARSHP
jgi:AcrR family transcriptional regulator